MFGKNFYRSKCFSFLVSCSTHVSWRTKKSRTYVTLATKKNNVSQVPSLLSHFVLSSIVVKSFLYIFFFKELLFVECRAYRLEYDVLVFFLNLWLWRKYIYLELLNYELYIWSYPRDGSNFDIHRSELSLDFFLRTYQKLTSILEMYRLPDNFIWLLLFVSA